MTEVISMVTEKGIGMLTQSREQVGVAITAVKLRDLAQGQKSWQRVRAILKDHGVHIDLILLFRTRVVLSG